VWRERERDGERGLTLSPYVACLSAAVRADDYHYAPSRVVAVENTHNVANGSPLPLQFLEVTWCCIQFQL
jgi:hypothetical protein